MDLNIFDIIDLDAYGSPYNQLKLIFGKGYTGLIFITFIQTVYGCLNRNMLIDLGYSKEMILKIPTIFNKNGIDKFLQWLGKNKIKTAKGYFLGNKNYFVINCFNSIL